MIREEHVAWAAQIACQLEISAMKPGNVTWEKPFSDVAVEQFLVSSTAIGRAFSGISGKRTGEVVLQAVRDTRELAGCNTNLGILLLLSPLARAALRGGAVGLRVRLEEELRLLNEKDTEEIYKAIRIASPGGLGKSDRYDVNTSAPPTSLLVAMREASPWDSIAREYATSFEITFTVGIPVFEESVEKEFRFRDAVTQTFLTILSRFPDTLIARKRGMDDAAAVSGRAELILKAGGAGSEKGRMGILEFDSFLHDGSNSLNPGTTADITVAVLFFEVLRALENGTLPEMLRKW